MERLFLFFIDGIGLAPPSENNPIAGMFSSLTGGLGLPDTDKPLFFPRSVLCPIDATLGVKGEPQSATGQTSIFTGVNAADYLGYHLPAFPNRELVSLIEEKSLMKALSGKGVSVTSANMYSHQFFTEREKAEKNRFPVSTLTIKASGAPFRMIEDYRKGKAVFADITGELIRERGYDIEKIEPEEAGRRISAIMKEARFVFFEYFMTDHYGHKRNRIGLKQSVEVLDRFAAAVASGLDGEQEAMVIISDHGNAEDMTTGGHTKNPVPGILVGGGEKEREQFAGLRDLTDLYGFLLNAF
ncbi:MAG: hypothetical protein JXR86_00920 [Spirochaetales bacterium]|nr:hypothetical protein [Spirochaetales bacterium]